MNKLIAIYLAVSLMILVIFVQNSVSMPNDLSGSEEGDDGNSILSYLFICNSCCNFSKLRRWSCAS